MSENLVTVSSTTLSKLTELANLLQRASYLAREISTGHAIPRFTVPELKPQNRVLGEQAWFWTDEWQHAEKEVNKELDEGYYEIFDNMDATIAALQHRV